MADFLQTVKERVVVYDGAMGTNIHKRNPTLDDYWGKENCSEVLVLSRPDIIRDIHASFFEVGCDVVETNTFGGSSIVLGEFDLRDRVREINVAAAKLAKDVAAQFSTKDKPRFVAGSIGPTTKLPSLGHINYEQMLETFVEQSLALIEGGVDLLLIETCQDLLQAKIATIACLDAMHKAGKRLPLQVQVTLQESGVMLLGTEIGAALTALEPLDCDFIGLNCSTGPDLMNDGVRYLAVNSTKPISVLPNAGLPVNDRGNTVYKLTPEELAKGHKHFVQDYGVRVVGGCCGTTPEHLKAVVDAVAGVEPGKREVKAVGAASSAYTSVPLDLEPKPLIVAEEMNTTTRVEHFRNLVRGKKYDDILALAKKLVNEGSHMLDLCCAIVGEDEKGYITSILEKIATRVPAPVLVDSTEADVVEEALKRIPGKAIINSINLEDGEKRTSKVLPMAKRYGAAVIALTIDEDGMALTADKKVAIAKRIYELATEKYGIRGVDLIFDALTLPISTGQEEYRTAGMETLEAVRRIKQELPDVKTILGVSNISFGLDAYPRRVLNSVFMHEAVDNGLDMAIVNYTKIYPLYKIPQEEVELARKLIHRDASAGDPLQVYMGHFAGLKGKPQASTTAHVETLSIEDKLKFAIINGEKSVGDGEHKRSLEQLLDSALGQYSPLDIINTVLLDGMRTVGELFGARKMQLPSVLDSAGVMKAAVAYLEPKMEKKAGAQQKGTIVLATVKGDVHDIGKNLVDIILSNNGYKVVNLGIKQPGDTIIKAAAEHGADAIGLSGLLVKSTLEMKYVIQDLERQKLEYPVICGGAALTRKYVEDDLRREYANAVFYADDAFAGLHIMEDLISGDGQREARLTEGRTVKEYAKAAAVVIAGGGPTGLMLAGELALAGVDVAIVERRQNQDLASSRAGGLHARTIEVLDQRGIADRFLSQGQKMQVASFARVSLDISDFPTRHNHGLALRQKHIERILAEWVGELAVPIYRGCEVTGFAQDDAGVDVELGDRRWLRAKFLVGCDGGRSVIRKQAGIDFVGWDPSVSYLIAEVEMTTEPAFGFRQGEKGIHAIGKHEDGKRVGVVLSEQQIGVANEPTLEELRAALIAVYGTDYGVHNATYISRFTDVARQAASYRRGRVLLAGDAAHVHSPIGGQGLNTGVQDAVNLGWKLAQVVKGISSDSLLDTYHAERHPVGARVLRKNIAQVALDRGDERTNALRETMSELLKMDEPRKRYAAMMSGLDIHYDPGEGHPLLGRRMPDLDLATAEGLARAFTLLHAARPLLLNLGKRHSFDITPWADRVRVIDANYVGTWELPALGAVSSPNAVLIRPDGYVAWVGEQTQVGLADALTTWFGPPGAP